MNRKTNSSFEAGIRLLLCAGIIFISASASFAAEKYEVSVERGVSAKMRDGVVLRADIYRPNAEGKFPVLLERTPYNKSAGFEFGLKAAARGYVVIYQDVRGRYTSEGEWYTFKHESQDGYDSVEWAAALPYSNGKVGMMGGSYVGATQMLTAIASPPHLAAIVPVVTASNYHDGWTYQGGAFEQWFNESWTSGLAQDTLNHRVQKSTNALEGLESLPLTNYPLFNPARRAQPRGRIRRGSSRPIFSIGSRTRATTITGSNCRSRTTTTSDGAGLQRGRVVRHFSRRLVAKLYGHQSARWNADAARHGQRLLVMIGGHAGGGRKIGDVDFRPQSGFDDRRNDAAVVRPSAERHRQRCRARKAGKDFRDGQERLARRRRLAAGPRARARATICTRAATPTDYTATVRSDTTAPQTESADHFVYDPGRSGANPRRRHSAAMQVISRPVLATSAL